jgi:drug/metabolite transporter (DMT)-like permease
MPPFAAASLRFFTAGLVMSAVAFFADRRHGRPTRRQLLDYAFVGLLLLSIGNALVMWAEKTIPSGIAALVVATVPLWLTILDGLRRGGQAWTRRVWTGTLVGLLGVALVARPSGGVDSGHWAGILGLQVGALSWTVGLLYAQSVPRRLPLFTAAAVEMLAGSAGLLLESRVFGEELRAIPAASAVAWASLAYLAVFGSLVGFTAFAHCLNELPASTVGTYAYVNPVVAVVLGAVILGERLYPSLLAGALLILFAVLLSTTGRRPATTRDAEAQPLGVSEG